jgi:TolB-like protein/DNA-binding winged helix-turn-helix (wHTH) protein
MESTQPKLGSMRTGLFEIDLDAGELSKSGRKVGLQEQPFRVLKLLLQRQGALVTRQELQTQLWPADTYVGFDEGLNTAIRKLRTAFGDSADSPRFIETVPRRGYRFIAPVTRVAPPAPAATPDPAEDPQTLLSPPKSRRFAVRGVAALALLLILLSLSAIPRIRRLAWGLVSPPTQVPLSTTIRSLAVLPLENLSNEPAQEYFADGMTDQLITDLGQIKALRVISRTSIMQYKGGHKPIAQIARELNVDAVVEGTVMKSGNQVRITAQLIQAPLDRHLWARSYDGDLHDIQSAEGCGQRSRTGNSGCADSPGTSSAEVRTSGQSRGLRRLHARPVFLEQT